MTRLRPLIFLELRQLINSIKNTVRSPKRLIPTLLIGAWVVGWFINSIVLLSGGFRGHDFAPGQGPETLPAELIRLIAFLALSFGSVAVLYGAFSSGLLVFSIAHIDFLFPTPISRRKVLLVKLLKDYLKFGFWVAFFFTFMGSPILARFHVSLMPWGIVSIGAVVAMLLLIVNLAHTINIVFTFGYERLRQAAIIIRFLLLGAPASAVAFGVYQYLTTGNSFASLVFATESPVVAVVFAPVWWCTDLLLAPLWSITGEDWFHFALLWLLAAGSLLLLMSRRENLYEPSLGISARLARRKQLAGARTFSDLKVETLREKGAKRAGGAVVPPFGSGATSFVWKNILLRYRIYRGQLVFMALGPLVIVFLIRRFIPSAEFMEKIPFAMIYIVWVLSMAAQAEMRSDLKYSNIVKSMPIAAWKIVLAQVTSSVIFMAAGTLLFAAYLWAMIPESRGPILIGCAFSAPFVGFANISASLISALLYPDTRDMAQNYLCGMVGFLLASLALIPTVVLGVVFQLMEAPIALTCAVVAIANTIVGAAGVALAGALLHRFDPSSD